jgi:para-nitrobenzyl esterase
MQRRRALLNITAPVVVLARLIFGSAAFAQLAPPPPRPPLPLDGPTVKVEQGQLQGSMDNGVVVFRGVPYAKPPVGDLRWRAPQPAEKWSGVRSANAFGAGCRDAEDCLYLNIYQPPNATKASRFPVMLYMHGGGFIGGSGAGVNGVQFAKQGVVLISINYRLGRAGWFAHPALTATNPKNELGNYGLMDDIAALKWVQKNIATFGGDPKNVTIFGGSAGAIQVNYLMLAPQARGLFAKGISESGFGRRIADPMRISDGPNSQEQTGVAFAEANGIKGSDANAAKQLRALSWEAMLKNVAGVGFAGQPIPMKDGVYITGSAAEGFAQSKEAKLPYMTGGNSDEASLTRRNTNSQERFAGVQSHRDEFLTIFDPSISEPDRTLARSHAKHGAPTYVYHFSYVPQATRQTAFGMGHGGETPYVFDTPREGGFDAEGAKVATAANKYWIEFARTGNPGDAGGTKWPQFGSDETLLEFPMDGVPVVQHHFHKDRLDWIETNLVKQVRAD